MMKSGDDKIALEHIKEILDYQAVLSSLLRRKVSIEQAKADWFEKGYAEKYTPYGSTGHL